MRARFVVPSVYVALALYTWINFVGTNADGLASCGLFVVTLPVALVRLALTELMGGGSFVLLPSAFGYYNDYALYYWPAVLVTASLLNWIAAALSRRA